ncbi:hypothetical protein ACHAXH_009505, partial [Discostella pseudostelligera]
MVNQSRLPFAFILLSVSASYGCIIHNTDSGVCAYKYLPKSSQPDEVARAETLWKADLPFCGRWIGNYYAPCVPSTPTDAWTAADTNFPFGRLVGTSDDGQQVDIHSIRSKDSWIEQTVTNSIQSRIEMEKMQGSRYYHYYQNKDCQDAYARYTCWINFPRCSDDTGESLPVCQSVCENLFRVCGFASEIWRCEMDVVDGEDAYDIRAFFPGQPFKKNDERTAVCTPSIKGAAATTRHGVGMWILPLSASLV